MEENSKIYTTKQYDSVQSKNGNFLVEEGFYGVNKRLYKKP